MTVPKKRGERVAAAVHQAVRQRPELRDLGPYFVAFSGGADSLALLYAATKIRPPLHVVALHVDHRHRAGTGAAAKAAQTVAKKLGVKCVVLRPTRATKRTDENTLREIRRRLLLAHREKHGGVIALAHTADDLVETILMRMIRGVGPGKLYAMQAVPEPSIERPLLDATRADVEAYLAHHKLKKLVIEDPTNAAPHYLRNRIRHEVLPLLQRENPRVGEALIELARQAARDEAFIETQVEAAWKSHVRVVGQTVEIAADVVKLHEAVMSRLVRRAAGGDVSSERIAAVLALIQREAGRPLRDGVVQLGNGIVAQRSGGKLVLYASPMRRR